MIETISDQQKSDVIVEGAISLARAAREAADLDGQAPSPATVYRWTTKGVRGVKLETAYVGRRPVTSVPALRRFFAAIARAPRPITGPGAARRRQEAAAAARKAAKARAERELDQAGI